MHDSDEKGTNMKLTEHTAKTKSLRAGLFAMLRDLCRGAGRGESSLGKVKTSRAVLALAGTATVFIGALLLTAAALAVEPPKIRGEILGVKVFATRAHFGVFVVSRDIETKWRDEYAPAENDGEPPAANSPSWVIGGSGAYEGGVDNPENQLVLGGEDASSGSSPDENVLHHLRPDAAYYARFHVENSEHQTDEGTYKFTTTDITKPEIAEFLGNSYTTFREAVESTVSTAGFTAEIEANGAATEYHFEYTTEPANQGSWKPFTSGASGAVSVAEDYAEPVAKLSGLTPETTYYVRVNASNEKGKVEQDEYLGAGSKGSFTTPSAKPFIPEVSTRNNTASSAYLTVGGLVTHGYKTSWRFEYATSPNGQWSPVPGAAGTFSQAQAEALPHPERDAVSGVEGALTGLSQATTYYVRLFAEDECAEGCGGTSGPAASFTTSGPPAAATFAVHALWGETPRILGAVNPGGTPTSEEQRITVEGAPTGGTFTLVFDGHTTEPLPFDGPAESVYQALRALPGEPQVQVTGVAGGPYTVFFYGSDGGVGQPLIVADGSGLTPSGSVGVVVTQQGGVGYETHYHFQYVSQEQFEAPGSEGGFARATSTPEVGVGSQPEAVGADLPVLVPGETYHFRIVATNTTPGNPVVDGEEQTLVVPVAASLASEVPCPNEDRRVGPSAELPDCRAYEQVTPVDKEGSEELIHYGLSFVVDAAIGEDGDHLMIEAPTITWGAGPTAGLGPYFFSRTEAGWKMTPGSPQPETGIATINAEVFDPDLAQFGFEASAYESQNVEYRVGPPGGPYVTAAVVPSKDVLSKEGVGVGWVAASKDFSKLILQVEDHDLLGRPTATKQGTDLYEYAGGELRQVNVGVGTCGAQIVKGEETVGLGVGTPNAVSSPHAVSADGSRVFFEAVPRGAGCSEPTNLYLREDAAERTTDIGAYKFLAADAAGSEVLMQNTGGELFLYATEAGSVKPAVSSAERAEAEAAVGLAERYAYGLPGELAGFVGQQEAGLSVVDKALFGTKERLRGQIYRYDPAEKSVLCISCASSFDPEPALPAFFPLGSGLIGTKSGTPGLTYASANGDFVFFETSAALVPSDLDGEVAPESEAYDANGNPVEHHSGEYSVSSDVYEWRRDGLDGCAQLQGCLALITSGRGGLLNRLIGTADEGRDVFIYSYSQLGPNDDDTAGDVYDVRVDGGEPPAAPRPVECEGDACATPFTAPTDLTPASSTFHGAGDIQGPALPEAKPKTHTKPKRKAKKRTKKARSRKRSRKLSVGHGKQTARRRGGK